MSWCGGGAIWVRLWASWRDRSHLDASPLREQLLESTHGAPLLLPLLGPLALGVVEPIGFALRATRSGWSAGRLVVCHDDSRLRPNIHAVLPGEFLQLFSYELAVAFGLCLLRCIGAGFHIFQQV